MAQLAVAALLCLLTTGRSATITVNVDRTQSSLTLVGGLGGTVLGGPPRVAPYSPQVPGSMVCAFGGEIVMNDVGGGNVSFSGGSLIQAILNPNSTGAGFRPNNAGGDPFGAPWSGTDNYGTLSLPFGVQWFDAYRNLTMDITAGTGSLAGDPASGMTLGFTSGKNDMSGPGFGLGLSAPVSGWPTAGGANAALGNVTWDGFTLTVPVELYTRSFDANGLILDETWTGQFVAVVPEPSALAFAALGLVAVAARRFPRNRGNPVARL